MSPSDRFPEGAAQTALTLKLRKIEVQTAQGKSLSLACMEADISEQSYDCWSKKYGGLQVDQARKMKDLERENARLRRLVADLSLEEQVLGDVASGRLFSIRGSSVNALSCASWFDA